MARSVKQICPICGLEFYDLSFHISIDEGCPEIAELIDPECAVLDSIYPNISAHAGLGLFGGFLSGTA